MARYRRILFLSDRIKIDLRITTDPYLTLDNNRIEIIKKNGSINWLPFYYGADYGRLYSPPPTGSQTS